jgi:hypothetical protein
VREYLFFEQLKPIEFPLPASSAGTIQSNQEYRLDRAPNPSDRRRSERVVLQMKVTVIADDTERHSRREEAMTQVVNAHGGLLKMKMDVHVGQPMLLVNPKNQEEQKCLVVRVDDTASEYFSVAFEFDAPNPKFWPVVFPPTDWNPPKG